MSDILITVLTTVSIGLLGWLIRIEIRLSRIEGILKIIFSNRR